MITKEIFRPDIIKKFDLSKYQVLLIMEKFIYEHSSQDNKFDFDFNFYVFYNEEQDEEQDEKKDFEDIVFSELEHEKSKISQDLHLSNVEFVQCFYQSISNLEKITIISEWYLNGMYADIIQSENGIELDEEIDFITQFYWEQINNLTRNKPISI